MKRQSESGLFNWIDDLIFFQTKKYQRGAERREVKGRREKGGRGWKYYKDFAPES